MVQSVGRGLDARSIGPVIMDAVPVRETLENAPVNPQDVLINFVTRKELPRRHSLVDSFASLSPSNEILIDFSKVGMTRTAEAQTVNKLKNLHWLLDLDRYLS